MIPLPMQPIIYPAEHPAKFSDQLLPVMAEMVQPEIRILDPFAGSGKVFLLQNYLPYQAHISALEIEPEWCAYDERITCGDILSPPWGPNSFDAIVTSPTYGNRMADSFKASNPRRRYTYTHKLGRKLSANNSGAMQWGKKYRYFHVDAWRVITTLLKPDGVLVLNMADHIRNRQRQYVTRWHVKTLCDLGFIPVQGRRVETAGMRDGQNRESRLGFEYVIKFQKADEN